MEPPSSDPGWEGRWVSYGDGAAVPGFVCEWDMAGDLDEDGLLDLIAFPMMILSGVWFSMEGTNIWAQRLAELMPLTHLVDAARRIMLDGASLSDVSTEIAILLGIALVLLGLSARAFRWQ